MNVVLQTKVLGHRVLSRLGLIKPHSPNPGPFYIPYRSVNGVWYFHERIVEYGFIYNHIDFDGHGKRLLDFGCTNSWLVLSLAALGYDVTGVDLRPYQFTHPNLRFVQTDILDFADEGDGFDVITAVSVLEHVGLGAYGEPKDSDKLVAVTTKLGTLLKDTGKMLVTIPCGQPYADTFLRAFSQSQLVDLIQKCGLRIEKQDWFRREANQHWRRCTEAEADRIILSKEVYQGKCGTNGVTCLVLRRTERQAHAV